MRTFAHNRFVVFLLCFALLAKLAIPVGFMPDMQALAHGIYKITVCSAEGAKQIWVDHGQKQDHPAPQAGHDQCPFAAAHLLAPPVLTFIVVPFILRALMLSPPRTERLSLLATIIAWPRGPPALN
jgi:hypothetical protein